MNGDIVDNQWFFKESQKIREKLTAWRRDFHQNPEIGLQLPRTSRIVAEELEKLGCQVLTEIGESGVVGLIEGGKPGPVVLARFDMDALPITEQTGAPYASIVDGAMHACGHDGHTAVGLGVATLLSRIRESLPGTVKLVFQPGEEGQLGALAMIRDGVLENPKPDACLAMHLWNTEPVGWIGISPGPVMAGAEKIEIRVQGKGGHGSAPELALDPILAGSQIVVSLQSVVSRTVSPIDAAVVSITSIHAGTTFNVIPDDLIMEGTVRTFEPGVREQVLGRMREIVENSAIALGCSAELKVQQLSGPVFNQPEMIGYLRETAADLLPDARIDTDCRVMGSEDMAEFLKRVPGAYLFVGSSNSTKGLDGAHHNPRFDFDEEVLPVSTALMCAAVLRVLTEE